MEHKRFGTGSPVEVRKIAWIAPGCAEEDWRPATVIKDTGDVVAVAYVNHSREIVKSAHVRPASPSMKEDR